MNQLRKRDKPVFDGGSQGDALGGGLPPEEPNTIERARQ